MTTEAFIAILNTGKPVIAESKVHQKMHELPRKPLKSQPKSIKDIMMKKTSEC